MKGLISSTLIITILLILTFGAISYAVGNIVGIIPKTVNSETCHNSVIARNTANKAWFPGQVAVSLEKIPFLCKTHKICLTMGGKCPTGYEKISVVSDAEIKKAIAGEMYNCWWMLGEGKMDFLGTWQSGFFSTLHCVVCAEIEFDDKIKSKFQTIDGLNKYMYETPVPGKNITYLQYLSNNPNVQLDTSVKDSISVQKQGIIFYVGRYTLFKDFLVHTAIGTAAGGIVGVKVGAIIGSIIPGAGTAAGAGVGLMVGSLTGTIGGAVESIFYQKGEDTNITSVLLVPYSPESFASCQSIESIP